MVVFLLIYLLIFDFFNVRLDATGLHDQKRAPCRPIGAKTQVSLQAGDIYCGTKFNASLCQLISLSMFSELNLGKICFNSGYKFGGIL